MIQRTVILVVLTVFALGGCSFVGLTAEGEKVRALQVDDVQSCRKLGRTATSVLATIIGISRPQSSVEEELLTVGRNSAANMGGDTVVATTPAVDGQQTFTVYKCVDPSG